MFVATLLRGGQHVKIQLLTNCTVHFSPEELDKFRQEMSKRQPASKAEKLDEASGVKEVTDKKEEEGSGEKKEMDFEVADTVGGLPNGDIPRGHPPELMVGEGH